MRSEELRIGNWVRFFDEATEREMNGGDFMYPDLIDPIPLTEEWLKRLGFHHTIEDGIEFWIDFPNCDMMITKESPKHFSARRYSELDGSSMWLCYIKYVHQLQNLYFALTGEELKTINDE